MVEKNVERDLKKWLKESNKEFDKIGLIEKLFMTRRKIFFCGYLSGKKKYINNLPLQRFEGNRGQRL